MEKLEEKIEREALKMAQAHIQRHPPYYGQIPTALGRDPNIPGQVKALFPNMHSYSPEKELNKMCTVEVSKQTLAKDNGVSEKTINEWLNILIEAGWAAKIRQGKMKSNLYVLFPMKKKTFQDIKAMKRVHLRLNYDYDLAKSLKKSLYE